MNVYIRGGEKEEEVLRSCGEQSVRVNSAHNPCVDVHHSPGFLSRTDTQSFNNESCIC